MWKAAKKQGKNVDLIEVENCGHMDFLEPRSIAFQKFVDCLGGEFNVLSKMW